MGANLSYPGVYVVEKNSLLLTVTAGATAVPAFICSKTEFETIWGSSKTSQRINNWLEVGAMAVASAKAAKPALTAEEGEEARKAAADSMIGRALEIYFENGGGYCHVFSFAAAATSRKATGEVDTTAGAVPDLSSILGYGDVTLVVQAGCAGAQTAISKICSKTSEPFAIYDAPADYAGTGNTGLPGSTPFGAVYFPWLTKSGRVDADKKLLDFPPSAAVAGVYCSVDRERGVWKAPANIALKGGLQVSINLSNEQQGTINKQKQAVNVIRRFGDGAPVVWGARTLAGNDEKWRYVPVRRLFNAIEKDIKRAMGFAVFEPNNAPTWERVRAAIESYLYDIWKQGGLVGAKPEEAYSIRIGKDLTMTQAQIDNGQMIVQVGLAAVRPAEFIVLQFSQTVDVK